jgi:hypothetical protein
VAGNDGSEKECHEMLDAINEKFIPNRILIYVNNSKTGKFQGVKNLQKTFQTA